MDVKLEDGTVVTNVPEGTTRDELMSRLAAGGYKPKRSSGGIAEHLARIDQQRPAPQEPDPLQGVSYVSQQLKKGVAAGLGAPVDLTTTLMNLGIAGYGTAKGALTGSSDLPQLISDPVGGAGTFERMFQTNNAVQPTGPVNQVVGRVVRDLGAASVPIVSMAGKPAAFMPRDLSPVQRLAANTQGVGVPLAVGPALSVAGSTGGELAQSVVPDRFKHTADQTGQLLGGIAVPAMLSSRVQAVKSLADAGRPENANRLAGQYVENKLQSDVRNFPGARDRLSQALALEEEIPGLQYRVGQASDVPSLLDMERRVATSGPEQFNKRALQDLEQRNVIRSEAERRLPLLSGKSDVGARLEATQTERRGIASDLPEMSADAAGEVLRGSRNMMKGRYDQIAAEKFAAPVAEAERLNVRLDPSLLHAKANELLSNPILQYDATNAPAVVRRIVASAQPEQTPAILGPKGEPLSMPGSTAIPFADLKAMREAVNQDIAREAGGQSPNARQRLRALVDVRNEIDRTAQQAPDSVRKLYDDATSWYRDVYAPKFLRGVNLKQSMKDITGELKIPDEKLAGQYFKKLAPTPMNRFLTLYGENPQAMRAMEDHILDTYRREVVKDGVIDPKKHDNFIRNYDSSLNQLPTMRTNLDSRGNAARLLSEREEQLIQAQSLLERGSLDKLRYEDHGTLGLDPRKLDAFLTKNRDAFKEAVSSVYGEKTASDHLQNLEKIAKAATIADRGRLSENSFPAQSTNPMDLRGSLGFSSRTVFNMLRAVTTGRTSSEDMAFTLGMQSATHRINKALIAAEERAISDPDTARLIAESMSKPASSADGQMTLRKILEKGGLYVANTASGARNYATMTKYRAAPFAIDALQADEK